MNPSGLNGRWFELDLLQEHFNFWIKRLFNSKSHDFDATHLAEAVSLNIQGFSKFRDAFPGVFGIKKNNHRHTEANTRGDIDSLGTHYHDDKILSYIPGREQKLVKNEFSEGVSLLYQKQLKIFLDRTLQDGPVLEETHDDGSLPEEPDEFLPSNPITISGGVMSVLEFDVGGV